MTGMPILGKMSVGVSTAENENENRHHHKGVGSGKRNANNGFHRLTNLFSHAPSARRDGELATFALTSTLSPARAGRRRRCFGGISALGKS
jgi:hypothetical protein